MHSYLWLFVSKQHKSITQDTRFNDQHWRSKETNSKISRIKRNRVKKMESMLDNYIADNGNIDRAWLL